MTSAREVVVEIDDHPLVWAGPTSGDYLSRWMASASQRSLVDLIEVSADGCQQQYRVARGSSFSDGSPVRARDHARAIRRALAVPALQRFLLDARGVHADADHLTIDLRRPAPHLPALLRSVDLAPISACGELSTGPYLPAELVADDEYMLSPAHASAPPVRVVVRRDPHEAPERYDRGDVDVTCATAFPLYRIPDYAERADFRTNDVAIQFCLEFVPGSSFAADPEARRRVLGALRYPDVVAACGHGVTSAAPPFHRELRPATIGRRISVRLGYWHYYPNRQVADEIADQLHRNLGYDVIVRRLDFVSGSAETCDLLLALRGPHFDAPLASIDLLDPTRADPQLGPLIERLSEDPDDLDAKRALETARRQRCPVIPLLDLQGHWLQRPGLTGNPWPPMHAIDFGRLVWSQGGSN
ncbi:peptide/nickel transport system substrate-binding protein [Nocardioides aurantiacus]|uniref:Peptide/nickel transport system substrate-binding protein n=1 Tax=Nocardioides aurantiacus TaxID=86796 RepID=A0A3N2CUP3_9ACTN|nr:peptide/nickel transport system substrate-binding protein [Nocardioides aurantiacus]